MQVSAPQLVGLLVSVLGIAGLAIASGTKRRSASNANSTPIVAGILMGTLVGGSSTVGTAQLAYHYGLSAWWFTLGGGMACLVLALLFCGPWRKTGCTTLSGMISREYGPAAGLAASLLSAVGTFINIISQLISGTAVIAVIAPSLRLIPALIITAAFMALYVISGGIRGVGLVGILKLVLLYVSTIGCGLMVLLLCGGPAGFLEMVRGIDNPEGIRFFSLFARGVSKDLSACLSLILGVMTTQTYAQAVLSGKNDAAARKGALISAVLIPPIGAGGILVGLYMRANYPGIMAKTALTAFATEYLPGVLGGVVLGTLFIAVVGTGAGLAMGISTIIRREIIQRYSDRLADPRVDDAVSKLIIVLVLALAVCLSSGSLGDTILNFAFMSMGLRGAVIFAPMCCALWLSGKVNRHCALAAIVAGPVAVLVFGTLVRLPGSIDALFGGIAAAMACCAVGLAAGRRQKSIRLVGSAPRIRGSYVLAVDSEAYSGAGEVAEQLAARLHIPCYGEEILDEAGAVSGISRRLLGKYDGLPVVAAYDLMAEDAGALRLPPESDFIRAQKLACRNLAERGSCIMLDRFASAAFQSDACCIRVFLHADFESRAARCAAASGIGPAAARRKLKQIDRQRRRYYRNGNRGWGRAENYMLSINATNVAAEVLAEGLLEHLRSIPGVEIPERAMADVG